MKEELNNARNIKRKCAMAEMKKKKKSIVKIWRSQW